MVDKNFLPDSALVGIASSFIKSKSWVQAEFLTGKDEKKLAKTILRRLPNINKTLFEEFERVYYEVEEANGRFTPDGIFRLCNAIMASGLSPRGYLAVHPEKAIGDQGIRQRLRVQYDEAVLAENNMHTPGSRLAVSFSQDSHTPDHLKRNAKTLLDYYAYDKDVIFAGLFINTAFSSQKKQSVLDLSDWEIPEPLVQNLVKSLVYTETMGDWAKNFLISCSGQERADVKSRLYKSLLDEWMCSNRGLHYACARKGVLTEDFIDYGMSLSIPEVDARIKNCLLPSSVLIDRACVVAYLSSVTDIDLTRLIKALGTTEGVIRRHKFEASQRDPDLVFNF